MKSCPQSASKADGRGRASVPPPGRAATPFHIGASYVPR